MTDWLYRFCERNELLYSSQKGVRHLHCTQWQVQSLHWALEEAAQDGAPLYLADLDFENAFYSVDHEAIWRWLTGLKISNVDIL